MRCTHVNATCCDAAQLCLWAASAHTKNAMQHASQCICLSGCRITCVWVPHLGKAHPKVLFLISTGKGTGSEDVCHVAIGVSQQLLCPAHLCKVLRVSNLPSVGMLFQHQGTGCFHMHGDTKGNSSAHAPLLKLILQFLEPQACRRD